MNKLFTSCTSLKNKLETDIVRRVAMVACAALLFVPVVLKSRATRDIPERAVFCVLSSGKITVKVRGDVLYPGVYDVPANSLAITAINLAVPVRQLVLVAGDSAALHPLRHGSAVSLELQAGGRQLIVLDSMTVPERLVLKIPLDISKMSEGDFEYLPGIGPALAKRIDVYRQNNGGVLRLEDLAEVDGIGEKKHKMLRSYFQHP